MLLVAYVLFDVEPDTNIISSDLLFDMAFYYFFKLLLEMALTEFDNSNGIYLFIFMQ